MAKRKHIPQRMCVACRQSEDKKDLVRIVRTSEGVMVDETGKLPGRGAYLHPDPGCWNTGILKHLPKALNTNLSESDLERLRSYFDSLASSSKERDE